MCVLFFFSCTCMTLNFTLDALSHQRKTLLELAQFVADGKKIPVRELDFCKKSLVRLNERCAKCRKMLMNMHYLLYQNDWKRVMCRILT